MPRPMPPMMSGTTKFGKYGTPRSSVEPYSMRRNTRMPPAITTTRGGNHFTSCDDAPIPMACAMANGMKLIPACSGL